MNPHLRKQMRVWFLGEDFFLLWVYRLMPTNFRSCLKMVLMVISKFGILNFYSNLNYFLLICKTLII
jgi:hypothetical protein